MPNEKTKEAIDFLNERLAALDKYISDYQESLEVGKKQHAYNPGMFTKESLDALIERIESASAERDALLMSIEQTGTARIEECMLLLRPIESLTDGEALTLARFVYGDKIVSYSRACQAIIYLKVRLDQGIRARYITGSKLSGQQTDYLRSIGIALPFTYLDENQQPQTSSVTEQESWGWIKLVEK